MERVDEQQDRVLAEVAHDLANHFHRFYYYFELLEGAADGSVEAAADLIERTRRTVEDIETLTKAALAFVRPMELRMLRVSVGDLVSSLRQHAGDREILVSGEDGARAAGVEIDPARLSEALATLVRGATGRAEAGEPLRVELIGGTSVGLRFHLEGRAKPERGDHLALALAGKILDLHGGQLDLGPPESTAWTLWLPVRMEEG